VPPQPPTTPPVAVALVGDDAIGTPSRPSPPAGPRQPDAVQHRGRLRAVMALPRRDDDGERPPLPVARQVELGRQPAPTAPELLVGRVDDPLFSSARLRRRRAPLACWWARAVELSTRTSQTTSPTASERVCT